MPANGNVRSGFAYLVLLVALCSCSKKPDELQATAPGDSAAAVGAAMPPAPVYPLQQPQPLLQPEGSASASAMGAPTASTPVAVARSIGAPAVAVGCSYDTRQIRGGPGTRQLVNCPSGCAEVTAVWGTDVYTADSAVCTAAIHAGVIPLEGGDVMIQLEDGQPAYRGSKRNGIFSGDYGRFENSFRVQRRDAN